MAQNKSAVYALILCGGESRRMGSDKASLVYKGRTLLEHTTSIVVRAGVTDVFSVGGNSHDIQDPQAFQGPAFATASALSTLRNTIESLSSVVVLPVDMPLLSEHLLQNLLSIASEKKASCYYAGQPFPFVLYQPLLNMSKLESLLTMDNGPSIRRLLSVLNAIPVDTQGDEGTSFFNVNSPSEWKQLEG